MQVVVKVDLVDALDRRLCVLIRAEQNALDFGMNPGGSPEELDPGHLRHPLVGQEECHRPALALKLVDNLERVGRRAG
jgi:hypothetical protein